MIEKERLESILNANENLSERMRKWTISYNKKADLLVMGGEIPVESHYIHLTSDGVLVRVDENNIIHGFAIENAKHFKKVHPEMSLPFSFVMYPARTKYVTLPLLFLVYQASVSMDRMMSIFSVASYVTKNQYAHQ